MPRTAPSLALLVGRRIQTRRSGVHGKGVFAVQDIPKGEVLIEYTGQIKGSGISVRNMVEGVSVTDGEVDISLRGAKAKINTFTARGGSGTVTPQLAPSSSWPMRSRLAPTGCRLSTRPSGWIRPSLPSRLSLRLSS